MSSDAKAESKQASSSTIGCMLASAAASLKPVDVDDMNQRVTASVEVSPFMKNGLFSDWTCLVGSRRYTVHRIVLVASSEYFRALFTSPVGGGGRIGSKIAVSSSSGSLDDDDDDIHTIGPLSVAVTAASLSVDNTTRLEVPAGSEEYLDAVFQFMYDHSIKLTPSNCVPIYVLADMLIISPLQRSLEQYITGLLGRHNRNLLFWLLRACDQVECPSVRTLCINHLAMNLHRYYRDLHSLSPEIVLTAIHQARQDGYGGNFRQVMRDCAREYIQRTEWPLTIDQLTAAFEEFPLKGYYSLSLLAAIAARAARFPRLRSYKLMDKLAMALPEAMVDPVSIDALVPLFASDGLKLPAENDVVQLISRVVEEMIDRQKLWGPRPNLVQTMTPPSVVPDMAVEPNAMYWTPLWRCVRWSEVSEPVWRDVVAAFVPAALAFGEAQAKSGQPNPDYPNFEVPRARPPVVLALEYRPDSGMAPATTAAAASPTSPSSPSLSPSSTSSASPSSSTSSTALPASSPSSSTSSSSPDRPVFGPERPPPKHTESKTPTDAAAAALASSQALNAPARITEAYFDWYDHISFRQKWRTPFAPREEVHPFFVAAGTVSSRIRNHLDRTSPGFKMRMVSGNSHPWLWTVTRSPGKSGAFTDKTEEAKYQAEFVRSLIHHTFRDSKGFVEDLNEKIVDEHLLSYLLSISARTPWMEYLRTIATAHAKK